jgi:hypothetical protein
LANKPPPSGCQIASVASAALVLAAFGACSIALPGGGLSGGGVSWKITGGIAIAGAVALVMWIFRAPKGAEHSSSERGKSCADISVTLVVLIFGAIGACSLGFLGPSGEGTNGIPPAVLPIVSWLLVALGIAYFVWRSRR